MNKNLTEYEKDLNEMKEQILKEGNTLLTKRDLLERFCEIDKEYKGRPWNLLQILANINILIGEKPQEIEMHPDCKEFEWKDTSQAQCYDGHIQRIGCKKLERKQEKENKKQGEKRHEY
jgi:hypothetical protein